VGLGASAPGDCGTESTDRDRASLCGAPCVISGAPGASAGRCPAYWIGDKAVRIHPWPEFPLLAQSTINSTETGRLDAPASGIWKRPLTAPSLVATSWTTT
jgi:hypothetical protein